MAIATLFAGLLAAGATLAPQAQTANMDTSEPVAVSDEIEVAAVLDSGDPVQLLNRGVDHARQGETEQARAMFTRVADNRMRYQMETAQGGWEDSRNLARKALGMLDRGEFTAARVAKVD